MNQLSDRLNRLSPSATLAMSQKSNELKAQGVDVINLSVGEPDFNTPDHIKEAAKKAVDDNFSRYSPVPGYPALRNAIVAKLKNENGLDYTAAQISCANGAKQSVCNTIMALVNNGDEVIVPAPYWVSYPEMVKLADGTPVIITAGIDQDFKITPAQLEVAITPKTKALILCSPSNPTGSVYTKEELAGLAAVFFASIKPPPLPPMPPLRHNAVSKNPHTMRPVRAALQSGTLPPSGSGLKNPCPAFSTPNAGYAQAPSLWLERLCR